jgi:hypothetical protein
MKIFEYAYKVKDKFSGNLRKLQRAAGKSSESITKLQQNTDRRTDRMRKDFKGLQNPLGKISGLLGGIGAGIGGAQIFRIADQVGQVENQVANLTDATGDMRKKVSREVIKTGDAFKQDYTDVLKSADAVTENLTGRTVDNLGKIKQAMQRVGGQKSRQELLEQIKEFPSALADIGASTDNFLAISTQAIRKGVFSDKGIDSIKEAAISLREMSTATKDALKSLDDSSLTPEKIRKRLKSGESSLFKETLRISNRLNALGSQNEVTGKVLADIFRGPGEDAQKFVRTLGKLNLSLNDVQDNTKEYSEGVQKLRESWASAKVTLANQFMPIFTKTVNLFFENKKTVFATIKAVGSLVAGYAAYRTTLIASNVVLARAKAAMTAYRIAVVATTRGIRSATVAMRGFKMASMGTGIGALIGVLTTAISLWWSYSSATAKATKKQKEFNTAREKTNRLLGKSKDLIALSKDLESQSQRQINSLARKLDTSIKNIEDRLSKAKAKIKQEFDVGDNFNIADTIDQHFDDLLNAKRLDSPGSEKVLDSEINQRRQQIVNTLRSELGNTGSIRQLSDRLQRLKKAEKRVDPRATIEDITTDDQEETQKTLDSVTKGGKRMTNVTINLEKLQEETKINVEQYNEGLDEMEDQLQELLLRILNGSNYAFNQQ